MDQRGQVIAGFIALVLLSYAFVAPAGESGRTPQHWRWEVDNAELTNPRAYTECLRSVETDSILIGRIAFNSPRLLGGQAGRLGLSCNSCHVAGRDNPRFFIEQVSDKPGKIDLSNAFFSSNGGDDVFNPISIPDISKREAQKFQDRQTSGFTRHIQHLIQTEFDGQPPANSVLNSLIAYLDALDLEQCNHSRVNRSFNSQQRLALETLDQIDASTNVQMTAFLIKSFRAQLESVYLHVGKNTISNIDQQLLLLSNRAAALLNSSVSDTNQTKQLMKIREELITTLDSIASNLELTYY